jgi:hypothetical protein
MDENVKLYSQKAIAIATYFGGPLAAGILIRRNSLNLGREKQAVNSLIIGIISTVVIFIGIFSIPEHIIDKIPNIIIPVIYTGIIYLIVEKIQGKELNEHKEQNGEFYSGWKAAGVGALSTVIIFGGMFGYIMATETQNNFDAEAYDNGISLFLDNETKAIKALSMSPIFEPSAMESEFKKGLIKWKENIQIINRLNNIENLSQEFITQNKLLLKYSNLRITQYEKALKSFAEGTTIFDDEMMTIEEQIDDVIFELN